MCPSAALGLSCPGCGGLRAVNDLTHGDLGAAASSNLLLVVADPVRRGPARRCGRSTAGAAPAATIPWKRLRPLVPVLLAVVLVFTVVRNLAVGAWLAP